MTTTDNVQPARAAPPRGERAWIWLAVIWLIVTAFNIAKPYHVDDTAHLEIARWIAANPLHPMSGTLNWIGTEEPIWKTNQPHLFFYIMAGWGTLFGYSELAMHTLQSLASLACIVLFHRLARHLAPTGALWLTAMFALCPAFVLSQGMMVDVPLLATWLAMFNCLLIGGETATQTRRYALAAVFASMALLMKYSSLVLLPILAASIVVEQRLRQAWTLLIPIAVLAGWSAFNLWDYGGIHIAARQAGSSDILRPIKFAAAWVIILGAISPLGFVAAMQCRWINRWENAAYLAVAALFAILYLAVAGAVVSDVTSDKILWAAFAAQGLLFLGCLAWGIVWRLPPYRTWLDALTMREAAPVIILILWVTATMAFYFLFPAFQATRHVLLVWPALLLIFSMLFGESLSRFAAIFALSVVTLTTAGLAAADYATAAFYRAAAPQLRAELGDRPVWTSGHWGWQWYSRKVGFRQVDYRRTRFVAGDILVETPDLDHQYPLHRLSLTTKRIVVRHPSPINMFCTARPSRFYMSSSQFGPWSLSRRCMDRIMIYRLNRAYQPPIPYTE